MPVRFRNFFYLVCVIFPHDYFQFMHIWQENHRSEDVFIHCILLGGTHFLLVTLLGMLTLIV